MERLCPSERVVKDDDLQLPARGALEGSRYQGLGKSDRGLSDEGVLDPDIAFPDEVEASVGKTDLVGSFLFHEISDTYLIIFKVFQCDLFYFQDL